jgi:non-ribosomal peptide synthetase component F
LARLIETSGATIMQATPATWRLLLECDWSGCQRLKLLCGGESLPRELADRLLPRCKELWNMYGPTETTIWSTAGRVEHSAEYPGIGRPIANTQVYVLDHARRPVPVGVPGELYIGGDGLARGYLRQPELTAERFVTDELSGRTGARLYRTGDLARWRPDGTLHCLGRVDQQLKIRGYRVEPAEIEAALVAIPDIAQAVVLARQDSSGTATLIAYVVAGDPSSADPARLRGLLRTQLPEYMIPKAFVNLERLPLTPNGKIDRKSLPEPAPQLADVVPEPAGYANRNEQLIAAIWQEVLGVASVSRHDNFFDLGGHSLLIVRVQKRLQQELNTQLPIIELFQHTTIAALAAHLADSGAAEDQYAVARDRALRRKSALAKETVA